MAEDEGLKRDLLSRYRFEADLFAIDQTQRLFPHEGVKLLTF